MKYDELQSFQDTLKKAKSFSIIVITEHETLTSSNIPISEYTATDLMITEALITKSVVSIWNAKVDQVHNVPVETIRRITYSFI